MLTCPGSVLISVCLVGVHCVWRRQNLPLLYLCFSYVFNKVYSVCVVGREFGGIYVCVLQCVNVRGDSAGGGGDGVVGCCVCVLLLLEGSCLRLLLVFSTVDFSFFLKKGNLCYWYSSCW